MTRSGAAWGTQVAVDGYSSSGNFQPRQWSTPCVNPTFRDRQPGIADALDDAERGAIHPALPASPAKHNTPWPVV